MCLVRSGVVRNESSEGRSAWSSTASMFHADRVRAVLEPVSALSDPVIC
jgi:hypothetical protein